MPHCFFRFVFADFAVFLCVFNVESVYSCWPMVRAHLCCRGFPTRWGSFRGTSIPVNELEPTLAGVHDYTKNKLWSVSLECTNWTYGVLCALLGLYTSIFILACGETMTGDGWWHKNDSVNHMPHAIWQECFISFWCIGAHQHGCTIIKLIMNHKSSLLFILLRIKFQLVHVPSQQLTLHLANGQVSVQPVDSWTQMWTKSSWWWFMV